MSSKIALRLLPAALIGRCARSASLTFLGAAAFLLFAPLSFGADDNVTGTDGTPGMDGAAPGAPGTAGGPGQSVTADADFTSPNTDASNTAEATGGNGGQGGNGAAGDSTIPNGGNGGDGGAGGAATAQTATTTSGATAGQAISTAQGGNGGAGGAGGAGFGTGRTARKEMAELAARRIALRLFPRRLGWERPKRRARAGMAAMARTAGSERRPQLRRRERRRAGRSQFSLRRPAAMAGRVQALETSGARVVEHRAPSPRRELRPGQVALMLKQSLAPARAARDSMAQMAGSAAVRSRTIPSPVPPLAAR